MRPADVNEQQWSAITDATRHLLVVAGPGTGKTHTLTRRIEYFVPRLQDKQGILAITFTNKASREMGDRLFRPSTLLVNRVSVGTFHSFCLRLLQENFAGSLPVNFKVPSQEEIENLSKDLWPQLKAVERRRLLAEISFRKAKDFSLALLPEAQAYHAALRQKGWLDFDDLLTESVRLLRSQKNILENIRQTYPFIFVDEYQDINAVQHAFIKLLVGDTGHLTAIGDPDQSIYGFRGSDVKFFSSFKDDFNGAAVLTLSQNYRSAQNLLSASSQIISNRPGARSLELTAHIYRQGRLIIQLSPTEKAESEYVVHQIEKMIGGTSLFSSDSGRVNHDDHGGLCFNDIAVLFRLNSQRTSLEEALNRSGIPYKIFAEQKEENPEELLANAFKHEGIEGKKGDKVSLMTLHAAKGLEFAVVFIVGCEENLLPLSINGMKSDPDEERRLFYVGVTRAKEQLFLVRAAKRRIFGQITETSPSPFLADIHEELKEYEKREDKVARKKNDDQMMLFN